MATSVPALWRLRKADLCKFKFETSLVYVASSRIARAAWQDPDSTNKPIQKKKKKTRTWKRSSLEFVFLSGADFPKSHGVYWVPSAVSVGH